MVCGPEVARAVNNFENYVTATNMNERLKHHEQIPCCQTKFSRDVNNLVQEMEMCGNSFPFTDIDLTELIPLNIRDVADQAVVGTLKNIASIGEVRYKVFVQERIIQGSKPIEDP